MGSCTKLMYVGDGGGNRLEVRYHFIVCRFPRLAVLFHYTSLHCMSQQYSLVYAKAAIRNCRFHRVSFDVAYEHVLGERDTRPTSIRPSGSTGISLQICLLRPEGYSGGDGYGTAVPWAQCTS